MQAALAADLATRYAGRLDLIGAIWASTYRNEQKKTKLCRLSTERLLHGADTTPMLRTLAAAFTGLALAGGCARDSDTSTGDLDVVRTQLDTMWSGLGAAMIAGDTAKLSAFYSDSALFAETGAATIRGLAKIQAAGAGVFACCRYLESRVRPEVTELSDSRAFQFGTYRDVIEPSGQTPITFYGRFSAILDRDSTNVWRVTRLVVIRDSSVPPLRAR